MVWTSATRTSVVVVRVRGARAPLDLSEHEVQCLGEELAAYRSEFEGLFARREQAKWAGAYLAGLLQPGIRKSAEEIALDVPRFRTKAWRME